MAERQQRPRSSRELEAQIEATRARLASDIDEARERLSPRGLQREAMGVLHNARDGAQGAMSGFGNSTDRQVGQLSSLVVDAVKRYPVVSTAVGLALALLALRNGRREEAQRSPAAQSDKETAFVQPTARADLPPPHS